MPRNGNGEKVSFTLIREYLLQSYKKHTLKAVVKTLGLAYITPDVVLNSTFRKKNLPKTTVADVIQITRIVLKMIDNHSRQPLLFIVKNGENEKIVNRKKRNTEAVVEMAELAATAAQRIAKFQNLLTKDNVRKYLSDGF